MKVKMVEATGVEPESRHQNTRHSSLSNAWSAHTQHTPVNSMDKMGVESFIKDL